MLVPRLPQNNLHTSFALDMHFSAPVLLILPFPLPLLSFWPLKRKFNLSNFQENFSYHLSQKWLSPLWNLTIDATGITTGHRSAALSSLHPPCTTSSFKAETVLSCIHSHCQMRAHGRSRLVLEYIKMCTFLGRASCLYQVPSQGQKPTLPLWGSLALPCILGVGFQGREDPRILQLTKL